MFYKYIPVKSLIRMQLKNFSNEISIYQQITPRIVYVKKFWNAKFVIQKVKINTLKKPS